MVADFGIALAVSAAAGGRMTETGLSLGTPHYMSPEQATAEKEISARSDVYSLGSVLYEMLTGEPPHMGTTAQQIIMKIITEPAAAVTKLRKSVPRNVADAVARSLEKLPADRFTSAKEFAAALGNDAFRTTDAADIASRGPSGSMRARALVGTTGLLLIVALWGWLRPSPAPPDGSFLVYTGRSDAGDQLWVKRRDSYVATPLLGTAGVSSFTISPDGKWVAFLMNGRLSKIPLDGGSAEVLSSSDVGAQFGVAWLSDGSIVYPTRGARGLMRVSADGGEATLVWQSDSLLAMLPNALPDGRGVIFVACRPGCIDGQLWALDLSSNQASLLLRDAYEGAFVPSGHLVYTNYAGALMAVPFDPRRLTVLGAPQNTGEQLGGAVGNPRFRVSASGTLVISNDATDRQGRLFDLVWVDRSGRETPVDTSWRFRPTVAANNHGWALSPDGSRLAIGVSTDAGDDIWVKPLPRGAPYRLTFDPFPDSRPRWRSDGRYVTFRGDRIPNGLYQRLANGAGNDSLLVSAIVDEGFVTADDRWIVVRQGSVGQVAGGRNVNALRIGTDTAPRPLLSSDFDEMAMAISPDGKWIAYQSDETGPTEVFIRSFPDVNAHKKQVSSGGGFAPLWSRDGRELFYLSSANDMMAASVGRGDSLDVGVPEVLFPVRAEPRAVEYLYYTPWDVGADGRFIMARVVSGDVDRNRNLVLVENWFTELKARLAR